MGSLALSGLCPTFLACVFAAGHQVSALAEESYLPEAFAGGVLRSKDASSKADGLPHGGSGTATRGLLASAAAGLVVEAALLWLLPAESPVGKALIGMAVLGAVIQYIVTLLAFVQLRQTEPELVRPYRSIFGVPGAVLSILVALAVLGSLFTDESNRLALIFTVLVFLGVAAWYRNSNRQPALPVQPPRRTVQEPTAEQAAADVGMLLEKLGYSTQVDEQPLQQVAANTSDNTHGFSVGQRACECMATVGFEPAEWAREIRAMEADGDLKEFVESLHRASSQETSPQQQHDKRRSQLVIEHVMPLARTTDDIANPLSEANVVAASDERDDV